MKSMRLTASFAFGIAVVHLALATGASPGDPAGANLPAKYDPNTPYQARKANPITYEVDYAVAITAPSHTSTGSAQDVGEVMDWLQKNMKYDHSRASLSANSEFALLNKTGHCSDYHGLCAAFGRALGLPTRVTYGLNTFPKNSPSHCKLEAFLPPYGWVSFDVSETQKLVNAIRAAKKLSPQKKEALVRA